MTENKRNSWKKVLLIGSYHGNNKGDEAIFYSYYKRILSINKRINLNVVSNNPEYLKKQYQVNSIKVTNIFKTIKELASSDILILGGGGLIFDYNIVDTLMLIKKSQLLYWCLISIFSKLFGVKILWISIGIGPLNTTFSKLLLRLTIKFVDRMTVRDKASLNLLREIGVNDRKIKESRDIVFSLSTNQLSLTTLNLPFDNYVLLFPMFWEDKSKEIEKLYKEIIANLLKRGKKIIISETNSKSDHYFSNALYGHFRDNSNVFYYCMENKTLVDFFCLIKIAQYIITMRMHATIIGSLFNVPSISIEYQTIKVRECMRQLGIEKLNFNIIKDDSIEELIDLMENNYSQIQMKMKKSLLEIKEIEKINAYIIREIVK